MIDLFDGFVNAGCGREAGHPIEPALRPWHECGLFLVAMIAVKSFECLVAGPRLFPELEQSSRIGLAQTLARRQRHVTARAESGG